MLGTEAKISLDSVEDWEALGTELGSNTAATSLGLNGALP